MIKKLEAIEDAKLLNRLRLTITYENHNRDIERDIKAGHPKWPLFSSLVFKLLKTKVLWPLVYPELYPGHEGLPFLIPAQKLDNEECRIRISDIKISIDENFDTCARVDFEYFAH